MAENEVTPVQAVPEQPVVETPTGGRNPCSS